VDGAARWAEEAVLYRQRDDSVFGKCFGDAGAVGLEGSGRQGGSEDSVCGGDGGDGGDGGIRDTGVLCGCLTWVL
jgi:hypothetical protein